MEFEPEITMGLYRKADQMNIKILNTESSNLKILSGLHIKATSRH